jgi:Predicted phosphohydrolases
MGILGLGGGLRRLGQRMGNEGIRIIRLITQIKIITMQEFKRISILHISDLHKNDTDDFDNLYQSMVDDCDRYVKQGILKPNIIVVSGDLIRGGKPEEITSQYKEARAFLDNLTTYFLNGDKSRIIIVPGNHDVDWNVTKGLMRPIANDTEKERKDYKKQLDIFLREKAQKLRWNWEDQRLYSFDDEESYNTRFKSFSDFYNSFYEDREFSLEPSEQCALFDIPDLNICFVGFNSCYMNDNLNKVGQILPSCVTKAGVRLKEMKNKGRVLVAVWHHNASGRPMVNNYLDNRILNPIIDMGVHIALHGHQHYSGVVEEYHNAFRSGKLLMYSTGSLYGATESLAYGAPRQYNILEMDKVGDKLKLVVHLRGDNNTEEFGIPNWGDGLIKEIGASSWETFVPFPEQPMDEERLSEFIRRGMENGDYSDAIGLLGENAMEDEASRRMMLDLMMKGRKYSEVIEYIGDPKTDEDAILLIKAAFELNDRALCERIRDLDGIKLSRNAQVRKMMDYL